MTRATTGRHARRAAVALGVAVALAVLGHPLWLAAVGSRWLSSTAGRDVHFDSIRVGLDGELRPVVRFGGVRIANWRLSNPEDRGPKDDGVLAFDRSIRLHGPFGKSERELVPRLEQAKAACAG